MSMPEEYALGEMHDWRERSKGDEVHGLGPAGSFVCLTCKQERPDVTALMQGKPCVTRYLPVSWLGKEAHA